MYRSPNEHLVWAKILFIILNYLYVAQGLDSFIFIQLKHWKTGLAPFWVNCGVHISKIRQIVGVESSQRAYSTHWTDNQLSLSLSKEVYQLFEIKQFRYRLFTVGRWICGVTGCLSQLWTKVLIKPHSTRTKSDSITAFRPPVPS